LKRFRLSVHTVHMEDTHICSVDAKPWPGCHGHWILCAGHWISVDENVPDMPRFASFRKQFFKFPRGDYLIIERPLEIAVGHWIFKSCGPTDHWIIFFLFSTLHIWKKGFHNRLQLKIIWKLIHITSQPGEPTLVAYRSPAMPNNNDTV